MPKHYSSIYFGARRPARAGLFPLTLAVGGFAIGGFVLGMITLSRLIYSAPLLPRRRIEKARWCMFQSMRRRRPHPLLPTPKNRPAAPNSAHRSRKSRLRVTARPTPTDVAVVLTAVVAMRRFRRSKKKPLKTGFEKLCRFAAGAKGQAPGPHILVDGGRSPCTATALSFRPRQRRRRYQLPAECQRRPHQRLIQLLVRHRPHFPRASM